MKYTEFKNMLLNQLGTYGLEQEFRKLPTCVKYHRHLSVTIPERIKQKKTNQSYNFSPNTACINQSGMILNMRDITVFGNSATITNIIRGLYDLSMRIPQNELQQKCLDFVTSYVYFFGISCLINAPSLNQAHINLNRKYIIGQYITLINKYFHIDQNAKKNLTRAFYQGILAYHTFGSEHNIEVEPSKLSVLDDFIYRAPDVNEVEDRMRQFHTKYENLDTSQDTFIQNAAWIIHEFCLIHPFKDGNGRISRMLCSEFLKKRDPRLSFTPDEITNLGKDPDYISATDRSDKPGGLGKICRWIDKIVTYKLNMSDDPSAAAESKCFEH